jgi:VWFA-related protein
MLRYFKCILGPALTLASLASAQTQQQTASSVTSTQSPAKPPVPTIHTGTKLVVVDVTVSDKNGNPIYGLKQEDFAILENGNQQTIGTFDEHIALSANDADKFPPMPPMPPGVFTNITPTPVNSAVNIILIDSLNTPYDDQAYLRSQLTNYIAHARPGASIAIFGLTTTLKMLQGFTTDPEVLKRVVSKQAGNASPLIARMQTGENATDIAGVGAPGGAALAVQEFQSFQATVVNGSPQVALRARLTLDAFNTIARYLGNIPGRKNLVWFSGSFPIDLQFSNGIDPIGVDSFAGSDTESDFARTVKLLARAQVAVYPVDCRGVLASPQTMGEYQGSIPGNGNPANFVGDKSSFEHGLAAEHFTMERLASNTGGKAIFNENNLTKATAEAIEIGSNYYTLTYTPSNTDWKGDFRKIELKLARQGYTLAYRHGYYADDPDSPKNLVGTGKTPIPTGKLNGKTPVAMDNGRLIRAAMIHGAPGSTEILYKVRVLPAGPIEDLVAEGNVLSPSGLKKASGRFQRYVVDFDADAKDMLFPEKSEGGYDCKVEFVVQVYQMNDGQLINTVSNSLITTLSQAQRNKLIHSGFPFHQEISVPISGDYSLRIGVHDFNSDRIGSVEVPVASVKDLPVVADTHVTEKPASSPSAAK